MIKKGNPGDGFILCLFLNLLFNFWWGAIAVILFVLFLLISIPLFWSLIALFIWFGIAFLSTALVVWAVSTNDEPTPQRENLNPYSAKNSDIFGKKEEPQEFEEPGEPGEPGESEESEEQEKPGESEEPQESVTPQEPVEP